MEDIQEHSSSFTKDKLVFFFSVAFVVAGMFVFNALTPLVADDWVRASMASTLSKAISDAWSFYFNWDGRLFNSLFGFGSFLVPKALFNIINTGVYVALVFLLYAIAAPKQRYNSWVFLSISLLIWVFMPVYGQIILWQLGAIIYLWGAAQIFVLIWLFHRSVFLNKPLNLPAVVSVPLIFLVGLVAGNAAQNGSGGALVIISLFVIYAFAKNRESIQLWMLAGWIGCLGGLVAVVASPGNASRAEYINTNSLISMSTIVQFQSISEVYFSELKWLLILIVVLYAACTTMRINRESLYVAGCFVAAAFAVTYVMIFAPASTVALRTYSFGTFFLVAAATVLLARLFESDLQLSKFLGKSTVLVLALLFVFSVIPAGVDTAQAWRAERTRMKYIQVQKEMGKTDIQVSAIPNPKTKYRAGYQLGDITGDPDFWRNQGLAQYMGVEAITLKEE
ncbi:MAG: DUF6056 family protein [Coriobacteriia bacterium]|nr:DUF6056 family protein [Coriobacteriia bacterium]MCL2536787.1 DUF6056 family protein [Coriobacteriia bacterium]